MNTKSSLPVLLTDNFITVICRDKELTLTKSDVRYAKAKALYKARNYTALVDLMDQPAAIERYTAGAVKVYDGLITYNGEEVNGAIVSRILSFVKDGLPFEPLVKFLDNLYKNTEATVRARLYEFLEKNHLAITEDGGFTTFKLVDEDGHPPYNKSKFGKLLRDGRVVQVEKYEVGGTYVMPRENVTLGGECSSGALLYTGNRLYWNGSWSDKNEYTGTGRMLIAEVFPQDVCNVSAIEASKIAVCKLRIVGEYKSLQTAVSKPLVKRSAFGRKPDGRRFHNLRNSSGQFTRRTDEG